MIDATKYPNYARGIAEDVLYLLWLEPDRAKVKSNPDIYGHASYLADHYTTTEPGRKKNETETGAEYCEKQMRRFYANRP